MQIVMHLIKNLMQTKGKDKKNQAFQAKWYGTLRAYHYSLYKLKEKNVFPRGKTFFSNING